jgi:hypothetical protein
MYLRHAPEPHVLLFKVSTVFLDHHVSISLSLLAFVLLYLRPCTADDNCSACYNRFFVFVSNLAIVAGQGLRPETPSAKGTALPKPGLIARNRRARGRSRPYWLTSNLDEAEEWVRWRKAIQQKEMGRQIWEEGIWTMDRDQAMHGLVQDTHTFLGHSFNDITTHGLRDGPKETDSTRTMVRPLLGATGESVSFPFFPRLCMPLSALVFLFSTRSWGIVTNDSCTTAYVMSLALIDGQGARCGS